MYHLNALAYEDIVLTNKLIVLLNGDLIIQKRDEYLMAVYQWKKIKDVIIRFNFLSEVYCILRQKKCLQNLFSVGITVSSNCYSFIFTSYFFSIHIILFLILINQFIHLAVTLLLRFFAYLFASNTVQISAINNSVSIIHILLLTSSSHFLSIPLIFLDFLIFTSFNRKTYFIISVLKTL